MELLLLQTLQWRVTNATSVSFVCYLLRRLRLPVAQRRRSIREHALDVVKRIIEGEKGLRLAPAPLGGSRLTIPRTRIVRRASVPPAAALGARGGSSQGCSAAGGVGDGGSGGDSEALARPRRARRRQGAPAAPACASPARIKRPSSSGARALPRATSRADASSDVLLVPIALSEKCRPRFAQGGEVDRCFEQMLALNLVPKWVEPEGAAPRARRGRPLPRGRSGCLEDRSSPSSVLDLAREVDRSPSPSPPAVTSPCAERADGDAESSRKRQRVGADPCNPRSGACCLFPPLGTPWGDVCPLPGPVGALGGAHLPRAALPCSSPLLARSPPCEPPPQRDRQQHLQRASVMSTHVFFFLCFGGLISDDTSGVCGGGRRWRPKWARVTGKQGRGFGQEGME